MIWYRKLKGGAKCFFQYYLRNLKKKTKAIQNYKNITIQWIKLNHKCLKNVPTQIELTFIIQKNK